MILFYIRALRHMDTIMVMHCQLGIIEIRTIWLNVKYEFSGLEICTDYKIDFAEICFLCYI